MGRIAIIIVVGFALMSGGMKLNVSRVANDSQTLSSDCYSQHVSRNHARSTANLCLYQLSQDPSWREGYSGLSIGCSSSDVLIIDASQDSTLGQDTVRIEIASTCGDYTSDSELLVALDALGWPGSVDAGVTARCDVTTRGCMIVDGRDHDWDENVVAHQGVYGISTTKDYRHYGNSEVGGTLDDGTDVDPSRTNWWKVVKENVIWPSGYPDNPDDVLGITEGTLLAAAQSGVGGSQYVTDPGDLVYPLQGVTYVELPDGEVWNPVFLDTESNGILVVHNESCNAVMKNIQRGHDFKGLVIADDIVHVHNKIIGAVFLLTEGPSAGNCLGNGQGSILFSREAITKSLRESSIAGDSLQVLSYYE